MARDFYPFVEKGRLEGGEAGAAAGCEVSHPARVAVYDDASAAPRVVVIEPCEVRAYLEEITATVNRLSHEQGGTIPFMVIREIVENFIHAFFQAPTITILDGGNTIRFSDQGPGIKEKDLALEYGTSSATEEMKHYIRGVGSGLPYAQQYMVDKGGSLEIEDNISGGTVVTISTRPRERARELARPSGTHGEPAPEAQQPWLGGQQHLAAGAGAPTWYQPQPQPAPTWQPQPYPQPSWQPQPAVQPVATPPQPWGAPVPPSAPLDERAGQVMSYLSAHEIVGPTDLVRTFGSSAATWSRTLNALQEQGLVVKDGQKYHLTAYGRTLV